MAMFRRSATCTLVLMSSLGTLEAAAQPTPSFAEGQWIKFIVVFQDRRLVIYAKDESSADYVLVRDIIAPDRFPKEGFIAFQQEETGSAHGTMFDSLRIWPLNSRFDIDKFAARNHRKTAPRLGSAELAENFAGDDFPSLVQMNGQWCSLDRHLTCTDIPSGRPTIRTKKAFGDFLLRFDLYRSVRQTCNWSGVVLRTDEKCQSSVGVNIVVRNSQLGPRLVVVPWEDAAFQAELHAHRAGVAEQKKRDQEEQLRREEELRKWYLDARRRWEGVLDQPLTSIGRLDEDVVVGDVRWKMVLAKDLGKKLRSPLKVKRTPGRFVAVVIEVENLGKEPLTFMERNLYDKEGRRFETIPDAILFLGLDGVYILDRINPNVPRRFASIYEVPAGATDFIVTVSNLALLNRKESAIWLGF